MGVSLLTPSLLFRKGGESTRTAFDRRFFQDFPGCKSSTIQPLIHLARLTPLKISYNVIHELSLLLVALKMPHLSPEI